MNIQYADFVSGKVVKLPLKKGCPRYDIKLHLMVILELKIKWSIDHYYYSQVHSDPEL